MRRLTRRGLLLAAPAIVAATALERHLIGRASADGMQPGEVIVRLKPGVSTADIMPILKRHSATLGRSFAPAAPRDWHVECREADEPDLAAELLASGFVEFANFVPIAHQAGTPNDPAYNNDAWFAAIHAPAVWNRFKMVNYASTPPCINVDKGLEGSYGGGVFTPLHSDLVGQLTATYNAITGTADVSATDHHGDAVLGVMIAKTNNSIAVPSVGWGGTGIMVRAIDLTSFLAGFNWILANVTPPSFITFPWYFTGGPPGSTFNDTIAALYNAGHLVVGASGDRSVTPCDYGTADVPNPYAITATACSAAYARVTAYASYGPSRAGTGSGANACAPGGNNAATPPPADFFDTIKPTTATNYSASLVGTSFSAPVIAGIARFIATISPQLSIPQIRAIMTDQSLTIPTTGFSPYTIGCVDFSAVVDAALARVANNAGRPWFLRR